MAIEPGRRGCSASACAACSTSSSHTRRVKEGPSSPSAAARSNTHEESNHDALSPCVGDAALRNHAVLVNLHGSSARPSPGASARPRSDPGPGTGSRHEGLHRWPRGCPRGPSLGQQGPQPECFRATGRQDLASPGRRDSGGGQDGSGATGLSVSRLLEDGEGSGGHRHRSRDQEPSRIFRRRLRQDGPIQIMRDLTLIQAISIVGGVSPTADAEKSFILRKDKVIPVDFTKLVQKGDLTQNIKLEPGDTVVAPVADVVYLQGEVKSVGAIKYTQQLTLMRAITQGGGLTPMASGGRVDILRGKGEKRERIRVDVDKMLRAPDENNDVPLKPDDIIFVPQRIF